MGDHRGQLRRRPTNTARGTPSDLADLRRMRTRQASISRGVEARGSEHFVCAHCVNLSAPRTLGVLRALGIFPGVMRNSECGSPRADQRTGAMTHALRHALRELMQPKLAVDRLELGR